MTGQLPAGAPPFDVSAIGAGLPFTAVAGDLDAALGGSVAVVQAPPGTGKTTVVPPVVANHVAARAGSGAEAPGRVIVTAPRRVAVRAAARRLAELSGGELGGAVGYTVRGDRRVSRETSVEFATPGVITRRLLRDGDLPGVSAVILDEVHERNLDSDILLGMLRDLRELRDDLVLVAMSATVDAPRFAGLLGTPGAPAPIVAADSVLHPLTVRWAPPAVPRLDHRGVTRPFLDHVAGEAARALEEAPDGGDVLVFVPGVREVEHVVGALGRMELGGGDPGRPGSSGADASGGADSRGVEILALHGQLRAGEQDRVVRGGSPGGPRRIIVSTAIAESSLTVPGVRAVVDACLSRGPRLDLARGMSGLVTTSCAKSSAEQRAGRAARLGPGVAVRCIGESEWAGLDAWPAPEIAVADLTRAMLDVAAWGTPGAVGLPLPDAPPPRHVAAAHGTLAALGAIELAAIHSAAMDPGAIDPGRAAVGAEPATDARITDLGKVLAELPVDPRLGRALLAGTAVLGAKRAAEAVSLLDESPRGDLTRATGRGERGRNRSGADASRLMRLAGEHSAAVDAVAETMPPLPDAVPTRSTADAIALVTALAWPDRLAKRRSAQSDEYLFTGGTAATAPPELRGHDWLAVADVGRAGGRLAGRAGAVIRAAAPASRELACWAASGLSAEGVEVGVAKPNPDAKPKVTARRRELLGAIELGAHPLAPDAEQCRRAWRELFAKDPAALRTHVGLSKDADALRRRLALLHRDIGDPWPDVSDAGLAVRAEELLGAAMAETSPKPIGVDQLRGLLPWPEAARLDELVPERLEVPSGSRIRVDYPEVGAAAEAPPVLAAKLQECFGLADTPALVDGRVPVQLQLLSPAGRPLAVTQDLRSFWDGPYAQVRAEMRGRYPKHPWPEDPWTAQATKRTNRRK
ncbi:ATP-dependent RNA helicase [Corynebacterium hansenii]|uniref:ATP-dependent RNA helicase n=1 Tax=Corynebacterium hansenii TaxID=394964 RepID=A0ABV7ZLR4_9CORY|nr:ATP-dependent helicase C-terminal domain-containing protein [Corynebacterium hansenii]